MNIISYVINFIFLFIFSLLNVESESLIGKWKCDETYESYEFFSYRSVSTSELDKSGDFKMLLKYFIDYREKGTTDLTFQIDGSWSLVNDVLKLTRDNLEVIYLNSQLKTKKEKSDDEMKLHLKNNFPIDAVMIFEVINYSKDKVTYLNKIGEEFSCFRTKDKEIQ